MTERPCVDGELVGTVREAAPDLFKFCLIDRFLRPATPLILKAAATFADITLSAFLRISNTSPKCGPGVSLRRTFGTLSAESSSAMATPSIGAKCKHSSKRILASKHSNWGERC